MKLNPRQFCNVCRVLSDMEVGDVAALFVPGALPELSAIHEEAEEMSTETKVEDWHLRMLEVSDWAMEITR